MIAIEIDKVQLSRLQNAVGRAGKKLGKELALAVNDVGKKTKLTIGRDIRSVITIKKPESEKPLKISGKATAENPQVTVVLKKTPRLGLRHFGARQTKNGVSYKISKQGGRKTAEGAFQGPRLGLMKVQWKGNAFRRKGKSRLPIYQIKGVSAYGAYVKNNFLKPQERDIIKELRYQMERRINFNILRAEGLVKH